MYLTFHPAQSTGSVRLNPASMVLAHPDLFIGGGVQVFLLCRGNSSSGNSSSGNSGSGNSSSDYFLAGHNLHVKGVSGLQLENCHGMTLQLSGVWYCSRVCCIYVRLVFAYLTDHVANYVLQRALPSTLLSRCSSWIPTHALAQMARVALSPLLLMVRGEGMGE